MKEKTTATIKRSLPDYKPPYKELARKGEATPEEKKTLNSALASLEFKRRR
jgi:hypothetical protein